MFGDADEISVKEGDSVTLNPGFILDDWGFIQWYFDLNNKFKVLIDSVMQYQDVANGRYINRLKLDKKNGTLTIRNITTEDAGLYLLDTQYVLILFNVTDYGELQYQFYIFKFYSRSSI